MFMLRLYETTSTICGVCIVSEHLKKDGTCSNHAALNPEVSNEILCYRIILSI